MYGVAFLTLRFALPFLDLINVLTLFEDLKSWDSNCIAAADIFFTILAFVSARTSSSARSLVVNTTSIVCRAFTDQNVASAVPIATDLVQLGACAFYPDIIKHSIAYQYFPIYTDKYCPGVRSSGKTKLQYHPSYSDSNGTANTSEFLDAAATHADLDCASQ